SLRLYSQGTASKAKHGLPVSHSGPPGRPGRSRASPGGDVPSFGTSVRLLYAEGADPVIQSGRSYAEKLGRTRFTGNAPVSLLERVDQVSLLQGLQLFLRQHRLGRLPGSVTRDLRAHRRLRKREVQPQHVSLREYHRPLDNVLKLP